MRRILLRRFLFSNLVRLRRRELRPTRPAHARAGIFSAAWLAGLIAASSASSASAQMAYRIAPVETRTYEPSGAFSVSVRLLGDTKMTFHGVGNLTSVRDVGDTTSESVRSYDDGAVALDARLSGEGIDVPDDGRTNSWTYKSSSQVVDDNSGIAFHRYSTESDGSLINAESSGSAGMDMEYSLRFGSFGRVQPDRTRPISWGAMFGASLSGINAKSHDTISATLVTLTDTYSLDGAAPPPAPYLAPSTATLTGVDANGNSVTYTVDNTTFLSNRPYSRTETRDVGAAEVTGFWQVRGGYYTMRIGPWMRWRVTERFAVRASIGATYAYLGVTSRYDERLTSMDLPDFIRTAERSQAAKYSMFGGFAALDAEWWLSDTTGLFASFTFEQLERNFQMNVGGRSADVSLSSSSGFRIGITKLF